MGRFFDPIQGGALRLKPKAFTKIDSTTYLIIVASILFLVFSPGFIVNVPPNNASYCADSNQISDCPNGPNCKKCTSFWASRFTNLSTVWWHSLIVLAILIIVSINL